MVGLFSLQLKFSETNGPTGQIKGSGRLDVPCIPLGTVMAAMNRTRVDFFSLDIEGKELEVCLLPLCITSRSYN